MKLLDICKEGLGPSLVNGPDLLQSFNDISDFNHVDTKSNTRLRNVKFPIYYIECLVPISNPYQLIIRKVVKDILESNQNRK